MENHTKEQLKITENGIKIFSYPNPFLHSFQISLYVRSGSIHETTDNCGISHFFEHIAIRNVNRIRDGQLYSELDRLGVEFNASTYSELVQFYVGGSPSSFSFAAGVLLDVLKPIVLSAKEVDEERARIKAEMRESDERTSLSAFTSDIVHSGTSLSRSITGTVGSINRITKTKLEEFRKSTLVPENIFFYVTGNVRDEDITELCSLLEGVPLDRGECKTNIAPVSTDFFKRETKVYIKNAEFTMPRFTFDLDMSKITLAEADLIYDVLLSGYNSEFFIELSEKRGLFYDVSGALERYLNIGTLSFSFELRSSELYEALDVTVGILKKMKTDLLSEERCMRAAYVDNAYMLLDDAREMNFTFAYDNHVMEAGYFCIDDRIAAYSRVTPERIREICCEIFRPETLTLTMKGKKNKIDTDRIIGIISNL